MPFNSNQHSHRQLRSVITEKTSKLVIWVGSGLSTAAGLPTWPQLKKVLVRQLRAKANEISPAESEALHAAAKYANNESNYWRAFEVLKKHMGRSSYRAAIRQALRPALTADCPESYRYVWKLGPAGVVNLNIDRLATKAHGEVYPKRLPVEFSGRRAKHYLHSLKSPHAFIVNLHGIADDESTWVFTQRELRRLVQSHGHRTFIASCFTATTNLFLGINADDIAAGGHLEALTSVGIDAGPHYWLTSRDDLQTDQWAERVGIQVIRYHADESHSEVGEFFEDILKYVPDDGPAPPPVVPERSEMRQESLPNASQLSKLEAENIRRVLNAHVMQFVNADGTVDHKAYEEFSKDYDQAIYRAWYTTNRPPENLLLGNVLIEEVARGAFGRVYRARTEDGREVAIKVLLEEIRRDPELLGSFRRGVRSMRFLRNRSVDGMVAYQEASEIPAFVVMDWVDGPTLSEALAAGGIGDWESILKVGREMTAVIRRAHAIPERVLHRDVRPSNVMFDGFYSRPDDWRVVVLDFDLSWHIGALEKSVVYGALTGYLAPEQIQATASASTRHAAVDSFGVGMTLYYMISHLDPMPAQHRHSDWSKVVSAATQRFRCPEWLSLPNRYARLVMKATEDGQAQRWDIAQINDELERLRATLSGPERIVSAELLAEEIAARSGRQYYWDDDRSTALMELPSGTAVRIMGNESERAVVLALDWSNSGQHERKQVGKWMLPAAERCCDLLRKAGWKKVARNIQLPTSVALEAKLATTVAAGAVERHGEVLEKIIAELTFE